MAQKNRRKTFFLYLIFLLCYNIVTAQTENVSGMSKFNAYAEVGSNIGISSASINLEVLLATSKTGKLHWYGRTGFGGVVFFVEGSGKGGIGALTMLTGKREHHFEASAGVFLGRDNRDMVGYIVAPLIDLGYRFQKPEGGFIFRGKIGMLGIGIGLGYAF